jgi:hypothetical protein
MTDVMKFMRDALNSDESLIAAADVAEKSTSRSGESPLSLLDQSLFLYQAGQDDLKRTLQYLRLGVDQGLLLCTPGAQIRWEEFELYPGPLMCSIKCEFGELLAKAMMVSALMDMAPLFARMDTILNHPTPEIFLEPRGGLHVEMD